MGLGGCIGARVEPWEPPYAADATHEREGAKVKEVDCNTLVGYIKARLWPRRYVCKADTQPEPQPDPEPEPIPLPTDVVPLPQLISCVEIEALKAGDGEAKLEPSAVVVTMAGTPKQRIHVAVLNGKSRKHVWWTRDKVGANAINSTGYESLGTPLTGTGLIPVETGSSSALYEITTDGQIRKTGLRQPDQYATVSIGRVIPTVARGGRVRLWDGATGRDLYQCRNLSAIVLDVLQDGDQWIMAGWDGDKPGVESTAGWYVPGKFGAIGIVAGRLWAIDTRGDIYDITHGQQAAKPTASVGANPFRARVRDGIMWIVTDDPHRLAAFNGREARVMVDHGMKDTIGSMFGGSFDFAGPDSLVWLHVTKGDWNGFKGYRVRWSVE